MTTTLTERKTTAKRKKAGKNARKEPPAVQPGLTLAPQKSKLARKPVPAPKTREKRKPAVAARQGSKTEKVLELLKRPEGATLQEIMKATSWQPHSVRGFLSGTLRKKLGIDFESFKSDGDERTYRISIK